MIRPVAVFNGGGRPASAFLSFKDRLCPLGTTPLCAAMGAHGSDKGNGWHNYTPFYHHLLEPTRSGADRVFECGIGSVDPGIPYSMADHAAIYRPGASLRGWRDYFPKARIIGADIDRNAMVHEHRITSYQVDQTSGASIQWMWRRVCADIGGRPAFDLMVDDGMHEMEAAFSLLHESLHYLSPRGFYIVEDSKPETGRAWADFLAVLPLRGMMVYLDGAETTVGDNCLVVLEKAE